LNLERLNCSLKALHDAGLDKDQIRKPCTAGTREQILEDIDKWADNVDTATLLGYWMCGMAGTGKSTIAKSLCLLLEKKAHLAASFFCSRQIEECRKYQLILPTIAYQLSRYSHTFAEALQRSLENRPDLASKGCNLQLDNLIIAPWNAAKTTGEFKTITPVIIIDALDECEGIEELLKFLIPAIQDQKLSGLKFFFTSRPETYVSKYMGSSGQVDKFELHNVEEMLVQEDIFKYLQDELPSISEQSIRIIVVQSGKLFIYAATIVRYLSTGNTKSRLKKVTSNAVQNPEKAQTKYLDTLYSDIITAAITAVTDTVEDQAQILEILYTTTHSARPVSCGVISKILGHDTEWVERIISNLQSVLYINSKDQGIYTFHASFPDYLVDKTRSDIFFCDSSKQHHLLAKGCFDTMEELQFNICKLPSSFVKDKEVLDINDIIERNIDTGLQYSCQFWHYHLGRANMGEDLAKALNLFIGERGVFWIEAMNLIRRVNNGNMETCEEGFDKLINMEKVNV